MSHLELYNNNNTPTSTCDNSTTTDPIQAAIKEIDSREEGASFSYRQVAKRFKVSRATLTRRHKGESRSNAGEAEQRMYISPQL
jgi:AraC-like DNA-binding protein